MRSAMGSVGMLLVLGASLAPQVATADAPDSVLFVCNDELLTGSCEALLDAIGDELEGLDLTAASGGDLPQEAIGTGSVPAQIEAAVSGGQVCAAVWLDTAEGVLVLRAHTPDSVQTLADIELTSDDSGRIDVGDAAFRLRALLAAALFLDLPGIEVQPDPVVEQPSEMIADVFPPAVATTPAIDDEHPGFEDPGSSLGLSKTVRTDWVRIDAGYQLMGFPLEKHWYHGVGLGLGVLVLPRLELFVDAAITAKNTMTLGRMSTGETVTLENAQYLVGLGLGYTFVLGGPVSLTPSVGFHLGISASDVQAVGKDHHTKLNTAIWGGFELRVDLASWIALLVGFSIENLFNYEYFEIIEGTDSELVFTLSQLRLGVVAGLTVSF